MLRRQHRRRSTNEGRKAKRDNTWDFLDDPSYRAASDGDDNDSISKDANGDDYTTRLRQQREPKATGSNTTSEAGECNATLDTNSGIGPPVITAVYGEDANGMVSVTSRVALQSSEVNKGEANAIAVERGPLGRGSFERVRGNSRYTAFEDYKEAAVPPFRSGFSGSRAAIASWYGRCKAEESRRSWENPASFYRYGGHGPPPAPSGGVVKASLASPGGALRESTSDREEEEEEETENIDGRWRRKSGRKSGEQWEVCKERGGCRLPSGAIFDFSNNQASTNPSVRVMDTGPYAPAYNGRGNLYDMDDTPTGTAKGFLSDGGPSVNGGSWTSRLTARSNSSVLKEGALVRPLGGGGPLSTWGAEERLESESIKVRVSDPAVVKGSLGRYTTYSVVGTIPNVGQFATRKRYSDFYWLQSVLTELFPGVFIPPIPKKQSMGRFDCRFVERRRQQLEEFLYRLLNRQHLVHTRLVEAWLKRNENCLETLQQEMALRSEEDKLYEFRQQCFARIGMPPQDVVNAEKRLERFRLYLQTHKHNLEVLVEIFTRLSALSLSSTALQSEVSRRLVEFKDMESDLEEVMGHTCVVVRRRDLAPSFASCTSYLEEAPMAAFEALQSTTYRELRDVGAMLDVLTSCQRLLLRKDAVVGKLRRLEKQRSHANSGAVSSGARHIVNQLLNTRASNDRDLSDRIEKTRNELEMLEEYIALSRSIIFTVEIPEFIHSKISVYNHVVSEFAKRRMESSLQETAVWKELVKNLHISAQNGLLTEQVPVDRQTDSQASRDARC